MPAHGTGGARATINNYSPSSSEKFLAKPKNKAGKKKRGSGERNFCPPAEAKPRRPARQEQKPAKKLSFPFRRKNRWRAQIKKCEENFFAGWRASASGGRAERQFRSKWVRAFSNKGHQKDFAKTDFCGNLR